MRTLNWNDDNNYFANDEAHIFITIHRIEYVCRGSIETQQKFFLLTTECVFAPEGTFKTGNNKKTKTRGEKEKRREEKKKAPTEWNATIITNTSSQTGNGGVRTRSRAPHNKTLNQNYDKSIWMYASLRMCVCERAERCTGQLIAFSLHSVSLVLAERQPLPVCKC